MSLNQEDALVLAELASVRCATERKARLLREGIDLMIEAEGLIRRLEKENSSLRAKSARQQGTIARLQDALGAMQRDLDVQRERAAHPLIILDATRMDPEQAAAIEAKLEEVLRAG